MINMGTISGSIEAKCKICGSRFVWHMGNFPFTDAEIIGTCDECFDKKDHEVIDEYDDSEPKTEIKFKEENWKISHIN